jgi:hypothetical protein
LSISSTVLVFVIIPLAFIAIVAALTLGGSDRKGRRKRYRPGRPYDFQPIWFLASPEQVSPALGGPADGQRALPPGGEGPFVEDSSGKRVQPGPTGGASDRW